MSTRVEMSRELQVPVATAYAQWTQFEDMKLYMDGVESVRQLNDDLVRVTYKRRGVERTWDARITEQIPDARIAWESVADEPEHAGVVTFHRLTDSTSKVMVQFDFHPNGFFEHYADKVGLIEQYLGKALDGFAAFIEDRKRPTGRWDGVIGRDDLTTTDRTTGTTSTEPVTETTSTEPGTAGTATTPATPATPAATPPPPTTPPVATTPDPTLAKDAARTRDDDGTGHDPTDAGTDAGDPEVRTMADGEIVVDDGRRAV